MQTTSIRKGTKADLPAIHKLVAELALYEKAPNEFVAGLDEYERDFARNDFDFFVAEAEGQVIGMALFFMAYSTWKGRMLYLEDFVVAEHHRGLGAGKLLFEAFLQRAREEGCRLVKWQVLDWNTPAIRFYEREGATMEKEWYNGKIFLT